VLGLGLVLDLGQAVLEQFEFEPQMGHEGNGDAEIHETVKFLFSRR
jgi:hypothetical protein